MKIKFSIGVLVVLGGLGMAWAQDSNQPPVPTAPYVAKVPDRADWKITVQSIAAVPEPATPRSGFRVTEIRTTKKGEIRKDHIQYSNGTAAEQWRVGSMLLWKMPSGEIGLTDTSLAPMTGSQEDPNFVPVGPEEFPGVNWVRGNFFDRAVVFEQRRCFHYVNGTAEAWIDAETRLPMAYKSGNVVYRYQFNTAPAEALTLPPVYQSVYETFKKQEDHRRRVEEFLKSGQ